MAITKRTWTDDSGGGTDGTILNNAELQNLYSDIDARWSRATISSTGTQNNLSYSEADVLHCTNASALILTGIAAPASPAKAGKRLLVVAAGAGTVAFSHQNASSTAANRLIMPVTTANVVLSGGTTAIAGGAMALEYDDVNARWRYLWHDQGAWITPTFAAGDFTANGAMTWTVGAGDVATMRYVLRGRTLTVAFVLATTTVGGTPNTTLYIGAAEYGGFTASAFQYANPVFIFDNGVRATGYALIAASDTKIGVNRTDGANWTAATDNTYVYGEVTFDVV